MSSLAEFAHTNYSLLAVPAAFMVGMTTHWYAIITSKISKDVPGFQNANPRGYVAALNRAQVKTPAHYRIIRAEAAQQNTFENLPLFATAVLAGSVVKLDPALLNKLAFFYVASRIAYSLLYIYTNSEKLAFLRSIAFGLGMGSIFTLFIKAAVALK